MTIETLQAVVDHGADRSGRMIGADVVKEPRLAELALWRAPTEAAAGVRPGSVGRTDRACIGVVRLPSMDELRKPAGTAAHVFSNPLGELPEMDLRELDGWAAEGCRRTKRL